MKLQLQARPYMPAALLCGFALSGMGSARAVTLEQKWREGQKLAYDVNLNGTLNLQAPPGVSPLGGIPIEAAIKTKGLAILDTLDVDDQGSGTIAIRADRLTSHAEAFGQTVDMTYRSGTGVVKMNGQPMDAAKAMPWTMLSNPPFAWSINRRGRWQSIVPLKDGKPTIPAADDAKAAAPATAAGKATLNIPGLIQSLFVQMLPTLWPDHEVNIGDTWTATMKSPVPAHADDAAAPQPVGKIDFTLRAEETIAGRTVQRIHLDGAFELSEKQAAELAAMRDGANTKAPPLPQAVSTRQKVKGDLWFDAAAGQVVKADLNLDSHGQTRPKGSANADGGGWMDFSGTLQVMLFKVIYQSEPPTDKPTP